MLHTLKNINIIFLAVLHINLLVLIINLASQLFFAEEERQFINSLKQFLKSIMIVKRSKKHFNKNLVMSAENEERFQLSNKCWI